MALELIHVLLGYGCRPTTVRRAIFLLEFHGSQLSVGKYLQSVYKVMLELIML